MSNSNENLGPDPSMEEILSSIRRILREDEGASDSEAPVLQRRVPAEREDRAPAEDHADEGTSRQGFAREEAAKEDDEEGVFVLDPSMMVPEAPSKPAAKAAPVPAPIPRPALQPQFQSATQPAPMQGLRGLDTETLLGETTAKAAASYIGSLMRTVPPDPGMALSRGGPTLDEIIREELRPLLRAWLDAHLPALVERVVQTEIGRLVDQTRL